ncbi:MAG: rhomboid family intramembrane serine protease [Bacteroidetes bacterium]|nr:rhomboid family intramembrane serine protease [Bacteroidota bacterium]
MLSFTMVIIILTCLISFAAFNSSKIIDDLIFWPPAVSMRRQYYRFITCGFIHADFIHLLFNMVTLYFFGRNGLEYLYRGELGLQSYYYPILYFTALIASNIPSYLKHKDDYNYRSLGASGAVCAVMFAVILIRPWEVVRVYGIPMPAILYAGLFLAFTIYMSKKGGDNVNHDAHLWGAVYGIVFTIAVHPGVASTFLNEMMHPR